MQVRVFDPALCCATGVCGPTVDPDIARFAGDVEWLRRKGVTVERFNLAQQPGAFVDPIVNDLLERLGDAALPLVLVGDTPLSVGAYPARDVLARAAGLPEVPSSWTPVVAELVAVGAAIGAGCEPCLRHHVKEARALGVSEADLLAAVDLGRRVRDVPRQRILDLADRLLAAPEPMPAEPPGDEPSATKIERKCC